MPGLPSPYWYGSRRPGRPCWTFGFRGALHYAPPEIGQHDREAADRWFLETLAWLDPDTAAAVQAARERRAGRRPGDTVKMNLRFSRDDLERLDSLRIAWRCSRREAVARVVAAEWTRRAQSSLTTTPPSPRDPTERLHLRLDCATVDQLTSLAKRDAAHWRPPRPNLSWTLRSAIQRHLQSIE